jgi:hypothetical protein
MKYHDFTFNHEGVDRSIDNYLMYGYPPGGFTRALLANDLSGAVNGADHWNKENLATVVQAVQQWMPGIAWGSYEIVDAWIKDKDGRRTEYAKRQEKLYMLKVIKGHDKKDLTGFPF